MSLFRSLSGLFSSALESTPPIIVAASRSLSLSGADPPASTSSSSSSSKTAPTSTSATSSSKPEAKTSTSTATSGGREAAIPEVDLSHLSAEERETIAAVLARANSADATQTDSDVERQVRNSPVLPRRLLDDGYTYHPTSIRRPFDDHSTADQRSLRSR